MVCFSLYDWLTASCLVELIFVILLLSEISDDLRSSVANSQWEFSVGLICALILVLVRFLAAAFEPIKFDQVLINRL